MVQGERSAGSGSGANSSTNAGAAQNTQPDAPPRDSPTDQQSYGSLASFTTAQSEQQTDEQRPGSQDLRSEPAAQSLWRPKGAGERTASSAKLPLPSSLRRVSSLAQGFHKRQEFSVDDDPAEVEAERQQLASLASVTAATGRGSLRKQPSTLRRRATGQMLSTLARVDSAAEGDDDEPQPNLLASTSEVGEPTGLDSADEGTIRPGSGGGGGVDIEEVADDDDEEDCDDAVSQAESFTLKDRQNAINETHPFGIRVWKPALYKKSRSVQKSAEGDIHSSPGGRVSNWLFIFNILWTLFFGWWLACAAALGAVFCLVLGWTSGGVEYGRVLGGLAAYLLYPFGKFVSLRQDEAYAEEDEGEGRSISEYEQWQSGDLENGRLFFGPHTNTRSVVGRRRNSIDSASETDSLLGRTWRRQGRERTGTQSKRRLFGRGEWNLGRVLFFACFYGLVGPFMLLASGICWLLVFWIPMGKITMLLYSHLRRHPLALSFHSADVSSREDGPSSSSILLCTYRAVGLKYWKYTIDGTNIFLINLMSVVLFVIFDYWILDVTLHLKIAITHPAVVFFLSLFSVVPLAYFIGQAVASISAQSSMGVGAAINAFFSTIVEVYLYCVALNEGKGRLVEGSIIGSIFAGVLFLPGISMCFGALKRKTQRFNAKSAGVTSTMLLFAVIAAFGPTLFYQIYGTHELQCQACADTTPKHEAMRDCRRCYFSQVPAIEDRFFHEAVRPYTFFAAALLFLSYVIGLWFTLRTHAAVIWSTETDEKRAMMQSEHHQSTSADHMESSQRESFAIGAIGSLLRHQAADEAETHARTTEAPDAQQQLLHSKRIAAPSPAALRFPGGAGSGRKEFGRANTLAAVPVSAAAAAAASTPHIVPPKDGGGDREHGSKAGSVAGSILHVPGLPEQESGRLAHDVAEVAAAAARNAVSTALRPSPGHYPRASHIYHSPHHPHHQHHHAQQQQQQQQQRGASSGAYDENDDAATVEAVGHDASGQGHDAPNWGRKKSAVILLGATVLYAIIAEILVNTVDVVLDNVVIDEKFLGITLFALVPNTTEFLNAISFAMNGNIALSMEIGSAYALQVCLLQIPALVLYSAVRGHFGSAAEMLNHTFPLIFPQWDMITVTLCVFLLSYMYGEGKSNYFKGSILLLSYLVVVMGFYLAGQTAVVDYSAAGRFFARTDGAGSGGGSGGGGGGGTSGSGGGSGDFAASFRTIGRSAYGAAY